MGRSVDYLRNAEFKIFTPFEYHECNDECGEDCDKLYPSDMAWDDLVYSVLTALKEVAPSLYEPSPKRWDGNETLIILENSHAEIGISEYCGLVSLSIRVNETNQYYTGNNSLSLNWIRKMWQPMVIAMMKNGVNMYGKQGTFSNGEGVYGTIDSKQYEYNYLKEKLLGKNAFTVMPSKPNKNWKRFNELGLELHSDNKKTA